MADPTLEQTLMARLSELRSLVSDVGNQLSDYTGTDIAGYYAQLRDVERDLDDAQQALELPPDRDFPKARQSLLAARQKLDKICLAVARRRQRWQIIIAIWTLLVLAATAVISSYVWEQYAAPTKWGIFGLTPFYHLGTPEMAPRWLALRAILLAACGGMAGAAVHLSRVLYLAIPSRALEPRRVLWYLVEPFFGAALAAAVFALLRSGLLTISSGVSAGSAGSSAATFAVGFLIGFVPSTVHYRIAGVVQAIFGTDEVRAPQISPPQVHARNGEAEIRTTVVPSAATRVASVAAVLQSPNAPPSHIGLQKGADFAWSGTFTLPADPSATTVTVEARDETGNVARSQAVSLATLKEKGAPKEATGGTEPPRLLSTQPAAGQTIAPGDPLVVRFTGPMLDVDPALTDQAGESFELQKRWNQAMTELTLEHKPLAPGSYRLTLEGVILPDETEIEEAVVIDFAVGPPPAAPTASATP